MTDNDELSDKPGIALFKGRGIRKTIHNNEWWFSIIDVIAALTDSADPAQYYKKMKQREPDLAEIIDKGGVQFVPPLMLEMETTGGRQKMNCWNTEGLFRLIQSIPSPKAEPFKRWLAKTGYERIQEIEDPELAIKRTRTTYQLKVYSDEWIEKRMRGIDVRKKLTDEWQQRGVQGETEYSILTSEISKAAFGLTPEEYKKHKGLEKPTDNLRDHMTDLELIFTMLGEAATTEIARNKDVIGFEPNRRVAKEGGSVAGSARKDLEKKSGRKVVSAVNYKKLPEKEARKLIK